jgi:hypothetical protein
MLWAMATLQLKPPSAVALQPKAATDPALPAAAAGPVSPSVQSSSGEVSQPVVSWWGRFQTAAAAELWQFEGVGLANLVWAMAKLDLPPSPQLGELLLWQGQRRLWQMDLQLVASLAWGAAKLQLKPRRFWLHRLCKRVSE